MTEETGQKVLSRRFPNIFLQKKLLTNFFVLTSRHLKETQLLHYGVKNIGFSSCEKNNLYLQNGLAFRVKVTWASPRYYRWCLCNCCTKRKKVGGAKLLENDRGIMFIIMPSHLWAKSIRNSSALRKPVKT